jgi:hypothetical protein
MSERMNCRRKDTKKERKMRQKSIRGRKEEGREREEGKSVR